MDVSLARFDFGTDKDYDPDPGIFKHNFYHCRWMDFMETDLYSRATYNLENFVNCPSRFTMCDDACPFHASMLRPYSQGGSMHESTGVGEVS